MTFFPGKEALNTANTSKAAASTGQDSLRIPLRSLFTERGTATSSQIDDEEELFGKSTTKTRVLHDGTIQPGTSAGEIHVTRTFHNSHN
jgi:hypothetical protein